MIAKISLYIAVVSILCDQLRRVKYTNLCTVGANISKHIDELHDVIRQASNNVLMAIQARSMLPSFWDPSTQQSSIEDAHIVLSALKVSIQGTKEILTEMLVRCDQEVTIHELNAIKQMNTISKFEKDLVEMEDVSSDISDVISDDMEDLSDDMDTMADFETGLADRAKVKIEYKKIMIEHTKEEYSAAVATYNQALADREELGLLLKSSNNAINAFVKIYEFVNKMIEMEDYMINKSENLFVPTFMDQPISNEDLLEKIATLVDKVAAEVPCFE